MSETAKTGYPSIDRPWEEFYKYGIQDKSVKKLAAIILGVKISKTQQLSNWEAETLSPSQQRYAATDAWVCREMYLRLLQSQDHA